MSLFNLPNLSPKLPLTPSKAMDAYFMGLALALARKGQYTTRPNPAVGCVLVRDEVVIGEGFTPRQASHMPKYLPYKTPVVGAKLPRGRPLM